MESDPPGGFKPLFRSSPFLDHNGPFFYRETDDGAFVIGLRIAPKHANGRGGAHGGLLMTICDIALGYRTTRSQTPSPMLTTASVTTDFAGGAKVGDWVEAHVDVHKVGRAAGLRQLLSGVQRRAHRACLGGLRPEWRQALIVFRTAGL